ncbi:MAG: alkaline phosphatase family protein [Candidatus Eisenbacteria bacterium]|uniref:Alkaline phosphatase family protein n=1 Tax=Eiseniibacteriota bacterium TaxID=2212470 RepID=A0A956LW00_UNCEI|nr:alkaline phosphatase family protein [Candidatus Eisenbacteria bacterium]
MPLQRSRRVPARWRLHALLALCSLCAVMTLVQCGSKEHPRLFVLGLDGATWDLIGPWIDQGELPNLKALRDQSAWGTLNSVVPCLSPPAWTTAITGVNPGRHNIFDFQRRLPESSAVVTETAHSRRSPPIWNMLHGRGLNMGIVNVPMTDPPDEVDGFMVAGFPHLDNINYAYPKSIQAELDSTGYLTDQMGMTLPVGEEEEKYQELWDTQEKRFEFVKRAYAREQYDFFWVVFTGTDRVQHEFWQFDDPQSPKYTEEKAQALGGSMLKFWRRTDELLGELLAEIPPDTWLLVVSDHGFGPIHRELRVGNYLRDPAHGFAEDEVQDIFSLDKSDGARLYVREAGRDPGATRNSAQRAALDQKMVDSFEDLEDPENGHRMFEAIYPRDRVFVGKFAERGPDLTLLPERTYYVSMGDVDEGYQLPWCGDIQTTLSGWHLMNGVFMLRGPAVKPGHVQRSYSLLDVVPTAMYVLEQTMAEDLEGEVMNDCLSESYLQRNQKKVEGRLNEEDRPMSPEEIDRLKNLPYVGK